MSYVLLINRILSLAKAEKIIFTTNFLLVRYGKSFFQLLPSSS